MNGEQLSELFDQLPSQWQRVLDDGAAVRMRSVIRGVVLSVQLVPMSEGRVATLIDPPLQSRPQVLPPEAYDQSPDMFVGVQVSDGTIIHCNEALAEVLEDEVEEIIGLQVEDLFHQDVQAEARQAWRRFLIEGRLDRVALGLNLLSDEQLPIFLSGRGEYVDGQLTTGWFVMRDRTEWVRLQAQLFQSGRLDALGRMTSGIVHDFNNFLQVLLVYANFLVYHHDLSEAALDDAKRVFDASEKAGRLTSRLLSFSQQRFGASAVVDINALVDGMALLMRKVLSESVEITYALSEGLPAVYVPPALAEQVLANLLLNAGEALTEGGSVTVSTHIVDEQDAYVRYRISAQPATFTVLHIVASAPEDKSSSGGDVSSAEFDLENLSLTVHEHGGRIREEITDDGGLKYWLYLPNALVDEPDPTPEGATRREMGGSERILIVEDDALVRWTIQRMLKAFGYKVFAAENATEALAIIRSEKLAMMITDVVMPETDGPTLIRLAREVVSTLPVLMISGYSEQQIVTEALLDTRTAFLPKPFLPGQLASAVRRVLDLGS
jgi:CheY-like chemotaxis protein